MTSTSAGRDDDDSDDDGCEVIDLTASPSSSSLRRPPQQQQQGLSSRLAMRMAQARSTTTRYTTTTASGASSSSLQQLPPRLTSMPTAPSSSSAAPPIGHVNIPQTPTPTRPLGPTNTSSPRQTRPSDADIIARYYLQMQRLATLNMNLGNKFLPTMNDVQQAGFLLGLTNALAGPLLSSSPVAAARDHIFPFRHMETGPSPSSLLASSPARPFSLPGDVFHKTATNMEELIDRIVSAEGDCDQDDIVSELIRLNGPCGTPKSLRDRKITLYKHQLQGLAWLIKMEKSPIAGGILADDMGLGKTIQTIALITQNPPPFGERIRGTLIVCPVSLMRQWKREIETKANGLSVLIYHGSNRTMSKALLRTYDIVITTYAIITFERGLCADGVVVAKPGVIFRAKWYRVILDEAHFIRNRNSKTSLAVSELECKKRFCLTGTPIQNHVGDVYSLLRFLRLPDMQNYEKFQFTIAQPLEKKCEEENKTGILRLQAIMRPCTLRRRKVEKDASGAALVKLPEKEERHVRCEFSKAERDYYEALECHAMAKFNIIQQDDAIMRNFTSIFVMILRLRQASNHPHLIKEMAKLFELGSLEDIMRGLEAIMQGRPPPPKENDGVVPRKRSNAGATTPEFKRRKSLSASDKENEGDESTGPRDGKSRRRKERSALNPIKIVDDSELEDDLEEDAADAVKRGEPPGLVAARQVLTEAVFNRLLDLGKTGSLLTEECPVCLDVYQTPTVTECGHCFCKECLVAFFADPRARTNDKDQLTRSCPLCRVEVRETIQIDATVFVPQEEVAEPPPPPAANRKRLKPKEDTSASQKSTSAADSSGTVIHIDSDDAEEEDEEKEVSGSQGSSPSSKPPGELTDAEKMQKLKDAMQGLHPDGDYSSFISSTKLDRLMELLHEIKTEDPTAKTVIFSSFPTMLDLVQVPLQEEGFHFCRYDGTMTSTQRDDAVGALFEEDDVTVMLISLKAGAVGLNLTCASRVILFDCWYNPMVEDQAIDRVYRIGQKKKVVVYRLSIKDTIEDRILDLQARKREIAMGALGEGDLRLAKLNKDDLIALFTCSRRKPEMMQDNVEAGAAMENIVESLDG